MQLRPGPKREMDAETTVHPRVYDLRAVAC
jgi:hypothetical protein